MRGLAWSNKRDYDRAIADFSQAVKLDRKLAAAYNNRGLAYRAKGDNDRAIADFSMAAKIDPNYALAFSNRGNAYFDKREYDRAIGDLNQAIKLNPNYVRAYYDRGIAYGAKGDSRARHAGFRPCSQARPTQRRRFQQSRPRLSQQRATTTAPSPISARRSSSTQIIRSPTTTAPTPISTSTTRPRHRRLQPGDQARRQGLHSPIHDRGIAYYDKHDFEHAIADFEAAIKINPQLQHRRERARRTTIRGQRGYDRGAMELVQPIRVSPIFALAYNDRGIAFAAKNDLDHAIADFDRAIKINPNFSAAYYNRGNAYFQQARLRTRHRQLSTGDQAEPEGRHGLLRPRRRPLRARGL